MKPKTPKAREDHPREPSPGEKTPGQTHRTTLALERTKPTTGGPPFWSIVRKRWGIKREVVAVVWATRSAALDVLRVLGG
jgi:hypothetical protein